MFLLLRQLKQSSCHGPRSLQNRSEWEAHREYPAVVVPVELRRGDLQATAYLRNQECTQSFFWILLPPASF